MKIIYEKSNGNIIAIIPVNTDYKLMFEECKKYFIDNLSETIIEELPTDYARSYKYYICENKMLKYTDNELKEKEIYGRILNDEERILEKLKPSLEEIKKAETTVEILDLLQEVL